MGRGAALAAEGLCIVAAFPLVVLERTRGGISPAELPEGAEVARLLRVPVAALLVAGTACLLQGAGYHFQTWILRGTAIFVGLVSAEVVLRAAAGLFGPWRRSAPNPHTGVAGGHVGHSSAPAQSSVLGPMTAKLCVLAK